MQRQIRRISCGCLVLLTWIGSARAGQHVSTASVLARAAATGNANKFVTAVYLGGLPDTLRDDGPFTVFVPIDSAFDRIPNTNLQTLLKPENQKQLAEILKYHVVKGRIPASQITGKPRLKTLEGGSLTIAANAKGVAINDATVIQTDIIGRNGIVHLIDRVLIPAPDDILETAGKAGRFRVLLKALEVTGLDEALTSDGPFTVFAPTDDAFTKLGKGTLEELLKDRGKLADILKFHVIPGSYTKDELLNEKIPDNLNGKQLRFSAAAGHGFSVNGTKVAKADIKVANGVIQVIESVLLPAEAANIVSTAEKAGQFGTLIKALEAAGLTAALEGDGPFTVLAPTDDAFAKLGDRTIAALLSDKEKLADVLKLHVIPGKIMAQDLAAGKGLKTLQGQTLRSSIVKGGLVIDESRLVDSDIDGGNGIIHVIDRVLIPSKSGH
jgi:transforming growth factor-beta-induced protein